LIKILVNLFQDDAPEELFTIGHGYYFVADILNVKCAYEL